MPVPYRQKGPVIKDWPALRLTEQTAPKYFANGPVNIGVILGAASGGLADIDLDCAEALAVAAAVLPPTLRFGRPSTRAAHWLYRASFPAGTKAAIAFDDPVKLRADPKAARLLELRTGAGDKAAQTVFPGSVHESGEPITWEDDGSAAPADDRGRRAHRARHARRCGGAADPLLAAEGQPARPLAGARRHAGARRLGRCGDQGLRRRRGAGRK